MRDFAYVDCGCGRLYLSVAGITMAMEGDLIRSDDDTIQTLGTVRKDRPGPFAARLWNEPALREVARRINAARIALLPVSDKAGK